MDPSRSPPRPSSPLNRGGSSAGYHRPAHTSHRLSPHLRNIAIRAALLAAGRADTTSRTKSDSETRDGTRGGAGPDLWISCVSQSACDCAPKLHAIFVTVEKAESYMIPHHRNICVSPCLPLNGPTRAARNRISPRSTTRRTGRYPRLGIGNADYMSYPSFRKFSVAIFLDLLRVFIAGE